MIGSEGDCDDFVLAHQKLGVSEGLPQCFEVIGRHVVEGQHIEVLVACEEGMNLVDYEFFMLSGFGFDLGEGNNFIPLGFGHQQ